MESYHFFRKQTEGATHKSETGRMRECANHAYVPMDHQFTDADREADRQELEQTDDDGWIERL